MNRQVSEAIDAMTASTRTLQRTVADLSDEQAREASLLPDWSRGHVLTHVARNADALVNLVTWAGTGVKTPMYASREKRNADIEAGSGRAADELVRDVTESHERLVAAMADVPAERWETQVRWGQHGTQAPAALIPKLRRVEVEVHHVDLDLDYTLAHLPSDFVLGLLARTAKDLSERDDLAGFVLVGNDDEGTWTVGDGGPEITGTPPSLLGWVLGRTDGIGLHSDAPLPDLGPWR
ncbi:MAG: maleylpyruvate isomerase family mycothiol-dependent enzyme [Nocardioidaceae bacterium]